MVLIIVDCCIRMSCLDSEKSYVITLENLYKMNEQKILNVFATLLPHSEAKIVSFTMWYWQVSIFYAPFKKSQKVILVPI